RAGTWLCDGTNRTVHAITPLSSGSTEYQRAGRAMNRHVDCAPVRCGCGEQQVGDRIPLSLARTRSNHSQQSLTRGKLLCSILVYESAVKQQHSDGRPAANAVRELGGVVD